MEDPLHPPRLVRPEGVAIDNLGNILIADTWNNRIRRVQITTGNIETVAGANIAGYSGDDGPATLATLNEPAAVVSDSVGNLFIADTKNNVVRKVAAGSQIITTIAGNGKLEPTRDGVRASTTSLEFPTGVAVDNEGHLFIVESYPHRVRRVDLENNELITTIAGNIGGGFSGDGGPAKSAKLHLPRGISLDVAGNLLLADTYNQRIRKIDTRGIITTIAGNTSETFAGDNELAQAAALTKPAGVATDAGGNMFIADTFNSRIRRVDAITRLITTVAGNGTFGHFGDNLIATETALWEPEDVAIDAAGNLLIADKGTDRVRMVNFSSRLITTIAGIRLRGYSGDGEAAVQATLNRPKGVALDPAGNIFIADTENHRIRRVDALSKTITTVVGNGIAGFTGDNVPAVQTSLNSPEKIAFDQAGNLFIADSNNRRIRKVTGGIITTFAGTGQPGQSGDNGPATAANIDEPRSIALDAAGNVYIGTSGNRVRRIDTTTGNITTVTGTGVWGFSGDGGAAAAARLTGPEGIAFTPRGDLVISDSANHRLRFVRMK
jgi:sugar lactone lactonase YvrE